MASIIKKRVMDDETTDRVSSFDGERDKKNLFMQSCHATFEILRR